MRVPGSVVAGAGILALLGTSPVSVAANTPLSPLVVTWQRYLSLDSQTAQVHGRTVVQGTVRNIWDTPTRRIQLLIEGLDASGTVVSQSVEWLGIDLTPGSHVYFEIPVKQPAAASYRVSVFAFDSGRKN